MIPRCGRETGGQVNVLLAIPQGMAYALVAGLPMVGLLGFAVAAIMGGIFGGGRFITLGPTNATAVLLFGVFATLDSSKQMNGFLGCIAFASMDLIALLFFNSRKSSKDFIHDSVHSRTVITAYVTSQLLDHSQSMQAPSWSSKFF